ncbi:uncharacterized protein LOC124114438 [Haliotis rufescens]|uniref:uncharacterized protein LOC124114438 n=1 Tax=Haliotis rufescens TaxID=6454 RepID=UPI00201EA307|nr:uncharacterized protein LOC124114438 [Haliotis rufescens]
MGSVTFQLAVLCIITLYSRVESESAELFALGNKFFDWRMRERPLQATKKNIYNYNDDLEVLTLDKLKENKWVAEEMMTELRNISVEDLEGADMTSYSILYDSLSTFIEGYSFMNYTLNPINFMEGIPRNPLAFVNMMPLYTVGDFENYIARLRLLPRQLTQMKSLMLEAIRRNATLHKVSVSRLETQIELMSVGDITKSVFFIPFIMLKDSSIPEDQWSDIRRNGYEMVRKVLQAYRVFLNWLRATYIPRTRRSYGVNKDYYEACLRWHTSVNLTAEEVHELGLREVERIKGNMNEIIESQNFTGTIAEYFQSLSEDPRFFKNDPADILEEFRSMITDRINPYLPEMFNEMPKYDIQVVSMMSDGPAGRYSLPTPDGTVPGIFYANVMHPRSMPVYTFMSLVMHEANPGHHFQVSSALAANTPRFMKYMENPHTYQVPYSFPAYTAFVEGWALYAESLGEEFGLYRDEYELMGRYSSEIFRAGRLVVDTGIHYYGWDREQAIEYLLNITAKARPFVEVEVDRYITWPGQACSYKIGELTIKKLRQMAEENLGDQFDIRDFHSAVLANGYKPLHVLTQSVKAWTASRRDAPTSTSSHVQLPALTCLIVTIATCLYTRLV